ncbi:barwin-like endoglucanase [Paxillus ammoniavirescens]|nr:barwin-like endoglucanase [Paxillus ammoniavirescens]
MLSFITMFSSLVFALFTVSAVSALAVPRATPPTGWDTAALESYNDYHCRYLALQCQYQHNTDFFTSCCHPLLANESISSRPADCQMPANTTCNNGEPVPSAPTPSVAPTPSAAPAPSVAPTPSAVNTTPVPVNVAPIPAKTTSSEPPATTPSSGSSGSSAANTGGVATYFYQNGVAGACGTVHKDTDYICAMDQIRYGTSGNASPLCGDQVLITNLSNGKTVTVTVADDCPTCDNSNSIDLSVSAFEAIADLSTGEVPISWIFL